MENAELWQKITAVIAMILVGLLVIPSALRFNMAMGTTLKNLVIWLLIFTLLVFGYTWYHGDSATVPPLIDYNRPAETQI